MASSQDLFTTLNGISYSLDISLKPGTPSFLLEAECDKIVNHAAPAYRDLQSSTQFVHQQGESVHFKWTLAMQREGSTKEDLFLSDVRMVVWKCFGYLLVKIGFSNCGLSAFRILEKAQAQVASVVHPCLCVASLRAQLDHTLQLISTTFTALGTAIANMRAARTLEQSRLATLCMVSRMAEYRRAVNSVYRDRWTVHASSVPCPHGEMLMIFASLVAAQTPLPPSPPATPLNSSGKRARID